MPTYDYECTKCGHAFEHFQSMTDDHLTDCPSDGCRGKVKRLIGTGSGIIFKGSGFYETDYRSDAYKKSAKADKEAATKAEAPKSSSSDKTECPNSCPAKKEKNCPQADKK